MVSTVSTSSLGLFEYKDCKVLKRFGVDHSKLEIGSEESDQTHETLWFEESVYFNGQQAVLDSDNGLIEFTTVAFNCFPLLHC